MKIAVSMDYLPDRGYFLKPDLVSRLQELDFDIVPLLYDKHHLGRTLAEVRGVLIPGGVGDVDPGLFGQEKKYDSVKIIRNRCDFEYELLEKSLRLELPILGICWGLQILNVYFGGTLVQDIASDAPTALQHEGNLQQPHPLHEVLLSTRASVIAGQTQITVNSTHHQAIDQLAVGLNDEGRSSDQIIECISRPQHAFLWAVQWHPERLKDDFFIPAFREACRR